MNRIYTALIMLLMAGTASAQQRTPLSLEACIDYALKHSYTIKNAQLDVLIQQAQVDQTKAAALPHINGKVDFNDFNIPQRSFVDASSFDATGQIPKGTIVPIAFTLPFAASAGITTSQTIFDGSVLVALQARKTVMELARQNARVTEATLRYNIFKSYNSVVVAYHQFDIIKSSIALARSMEHDMLVTNQNGMAEKIDVERATVQVNNLVSDSIRVSNSIALAAQVLKYQIGMDINTPIVLTDTSIEARTRSAMSLVNNDVQYDRVPEFGLATTAVIASEYNVKRYKLASLPSLSGFWSYGSNYGSIKVGDLFIFDRYWASSTIGLSLNVPIFNGFMRVNQVREAKLNVEKSQNNVELAKQTIDFQSASARTSLKNALLQVQSQQRNIDLSNDVLDLAQKKYKGGVGSNIEVTQAQTAQLQSMNSYFTALLDVINSEADLRKALGQLK